MLRDKIMGMDHEASNPEGSGGPGDAHVNDKHHAAVMQLERSNRELQQRVTALERELQTSERQRMHLESKLGDLKEAADTVSTRLPRHV
jgi:TolA-binding protein